MEGVQSGGDHVLLDLPSAGPGTNTRCLACGRSPRAAAGEGRGKEACGQLTANAAGNGPFIPFLRFRRYWWVPVVGGAPVSRPAAAECSCGEQKAGGWHRAGLTPHVGAGPREAAPASDGGGGGSKLKSSQGSDGFVGLTRRPESPPGAQQRSELRGASLRGSQRAARPAAARPQRRCSPPLPPSAWAQRVSRGACAVSGLEGSGFLLGLFLVAWDLSSPAGNLVALVDDAQGSKATCDCTPARGTSGFTSWAESGQTCSF